jgi:hypothetical protein
VPELRFEPVAPNWRLGMNDTETFFDAQATARVDDERALGAAKPRSRAVADEWRCSSAEHSPRSNPRGQRSSGQVRHVRMLGLCLVAALAVTAYAVSSASALPEWGKCEAKAGGKYEDANCTVKAKGKTGKHSYEWVKGKSLKPVPFSGHSVGSGGVLTSTLRDCLSPSYEAERTTRAKCKSEGFEEYSEEEAAAEVECEAENSSGQAVGQKSIADVHVTFTGCALFGTIPCKGEGAAAGEVKTNELKGFLGYINKAKHEVGVVLEPVQKHGHFAKFECGGIDEIVVGVGNSKEGAQFEPESKGGYDQIISPITPVNQSTSEYTQVYTIESEYPFANIPNSLQGKHRSTLEAYTNALQQPNFSTDWGSAGEEITNVNTPTEAGEIKA